jgi:hypothetical protein
MDETVRMGRIRVISNELIIGISDWCPMKEVEGRLIGVHATVDLLLPAPRRCTKGTIGRCADATLAALSCVPPFFPADPRRVSPDIKIQLRDNLLPIFCSGKD